MARRGETKTKDYTNPEFQTVSKGSLGAIYKVTFSTLVKQVKQLTFAPTKDKQEQLDAWTSAIILLDRAVAPLKLWRNRSILLTVLKMYKPVLEHFLRQGIPLLDTTFRCSRTETISILSILTGLLGSLS